MKKIRVNENCIGCGACTSIASDYFKIGDSGYAEPKMDEVLEKDIDDVTEAAECCPVSAIEIDD